MRQLKANSLDLLPDDLGEDDRGSTAIIGGGCLQHLYTFLWDFKKEQGHWAWMCFIDRDSA